MGGPWDPETLLVTKNSRQPSIGEEGDRWESRARRTGK